MTRPRQVTSEAILEAARACAVERGPNVSLEVIAERLGVTPPALLKRFGSREAMMIAALRTSEEPPWVKGLAAGPDESPLEKQLETLFSRILDFFSSEAARMSTLCESRLPLSRIFDASRPPPPVQHTWALASWLDEARARGLVRRDDFEIAALGMLGALHARAFLKHFFRRSFWRGSRQDYVAGLANLYARALAPVATAGVARVRIAARTASRRSLHRRQSGKA
ncbi:MAG TPA: helix-turn-helix domain-containing protein [Polyangiaceae bacterium]|jgi:AcrR family transcriptional regulator|nr:helix-turn-helix domain-containing protein [Polyangiaceae bacterium]